MAIFNKPDPKKVEEKSKAFDPEAFMKTFSETMNNFAKAQASGFNTLAQQIAAAGGKPAAAPKEQKVEITDEQIDKMTNSQLMKHLMGQVTEVVKANVKPVAETAEEVAGRVDQADVKAQFEKLKKDHPDLEHFREPMKRVLSEHPDLLSNLERAYKLARAEAPEIVTKLEAETKQAEEAKKAEEGDKKAFGGFFPGPSVTVSKEDAAKNEDGSTKELRSILSDTFDLVMKDVPAGAFPTN